MAEIVRDEQKARAELQALSFAEQIGAMPQPIDPQALAQAATLVRGARPDVVAVRVWKRVGGVYLPTAGAFFVSRRRPKRVAVAARRGVSCRASAATKFSLRIFALTFLLQCAR